MNSVIKHQPLKPAHRERYKFLFWNFVAISACFVFCYLYLAELNADFKAYITSPKTAKTVAKPYAKQEVSIVGDEYDFKYIFKDHKGNDLNWTWRFKKEYMDELSNNFGIAKEDYELKPSDPKTLFNKKMAITNGLFVEIEGKVEPNYHAITDVHNIVAAPLYNLAKQSAEDMGGGRLEIIELLLKFCQDMPIKEIPDFQSGRYIHGVMPPSMSLVKGFGDCDTKAMIFSSALANDELMKMVAIYTPNHLLIGVRGIPKPYQTAIKFKGEPYIVCQPSGPDRHNFGVRAEEIGPIQMVRGL